MAYAGVRYYDPPGRRLVYVGQGASEAFWDEHWSATSAACQKVLATKRTYVTDITRRYLQPADGPILEGGCGLSAHVAALRNQGYRAVGVDYAEQTVALIRKELPSLDVRLGDVRDLRQFEDGEFAGYWSIGVIEHFWNGYDAIAREMLRVLRPGGLLFLTFPCMSPLRRWKASRRAYPELGRRDAEPDGFYQFALDPDETAGRFVSELGFELVERRPLNGFKGAKDEIGAINSPLQALADYRGRNVAVRALAAGVGRAMEALAPVAAHAMLLVLRRPKAGGPKAGGTKAGGTKAGGDER